MKQNLEHVMHAAILCAEDSRAPHLSRAHQQGLPPMPFGELNDLSPSCQAMPKNNDEGTIKTLFTPVTSATPTLITSGQFDPVTPPFWGEWASQNMTHSKHIIVEGGHHGVSGIGCMPKIIAQFIESASVEDLELECVQKITPVSFFIDGAGPSLLKRTHQIMAPIEASATEAKYHD